MKRQHWQLVLAATLSLSCAGKHSQNVAPNNGMCENDNEILVAPDPRTDDQLEAERQVLIRLGLLQPTDPAKLVAGGIAPDFADRGRLVKRIERAYRPPGTTGTWTVQVIALVDAHGRVAAVRIDSTSGRKALDATALKVVRATAFKPAVYRGCHVRAQVALPITFAEAHLPGTFRPRRGSAQRLTRAFALRSLRSLALRDTAPPRLSAGSGVS